jgi:hypothetical protein
LKAIGDGEASKIAAIGEATAQAHNKQREAIGEEAIKQIKIVPDVLVTGGGSAGDGLMGMLTKLLPGVDLGALGKKTVPVVAEKGTKAEK